MPLSLPNPGQNPWAVQLNSALTQLDQQTVVNAQITNGNLFLTRNDGSTVSVGGVGGGGSGGGVTVETWDDPATANVKLVVLSDNTLRAVPGNVSRPVPPTGVAGTVRLTFISLKWNASAGASRYYIYRNGTFLGETTTTQYIDYAVTLGQPYTYTIRAMNSYGMLGSVGTASTFTIQSSTNRAPSILDIRVYPLNPRPTDQVYVRVNTTDPDYQLLVTTLNATAGSLVATADPTLWKWNI